MNTNKVITFVIPIKHQEHVPDWDSFLQNFMQTVASISAQKVNLWKCIIVANQGASIPQLDENFEVCYVDYPPNPYFNIKEHNLKLCYEAVREDKGKKILTGLLHTEPTDFFMVVDDDDLIHCDLTEFVVNNRGKNGWYIGDGFIWSHNSSFLMKRENFHLLCGTSHILKRNLLNLSNSIENLEYIKKYLGSHMSIKEYFDNLKQPLEKLPMYGAIYRVGHATGHSQNFTNKYQYYKTLIKQLLNSNYLTSKIKRTYFGES